MSNDPYHSYSKHRISLQRCCVSAGSSWFWRCLQRRLDCMLFDSHLTAQFDLATTSSTNYVTTTRRLTCVYGGATLRPR